MKNKQCLVLWGKNFCKKEFWKKKIYVELLLCELRCHLRKQIVNNIDL